MVTVLLNIVHAKNGRCTVFTDEKLTELICFEEMIMEGLDKSFWRLIKLANPQIWERNDETSEEYSWVLGIMGYHCVYFDGEREMYIIATFDNFGQIGESKQESKKLHHLMTDLVRSRFRHP